MADNEQRSDATTPEQQTGSGMSTGLTHRDLGTVGGGSVPGGDKHMGSGNTTGAPRQSDSSTDGENSDASLRTLLTEGDVSSNKIDKHAQGNLGGRNPSQSSAAMGDMDAGVDRADRGQVHITDPMTSRDPNKVDQETPANDDPKHKK